jgi:hypothetical protein
MILDELPIHWGLIFQVLSFITIFLMLWEIDTAKALDDMRWSRMTGWMFVARRVAMWLKALTLCWAVIYIHGRGWQPWPPIVAFMAAFGLYTAMNTLVMRADIAKLKGSSQPTRGIGAT